MEHNPLGRRFLKTRSKSWAIYLASKISKFNITPNQISVISVISAICATYCLLYIDSNFKWLLAIFFIQFRLFCNMLDGLVAIEGGKQSKLGDVYNDLPDRISDVFIIVAFGHAVDTTNLFSLFSIAITSSSLAWLAACLAVFTAYIRTLFTSLGVVSDYCGPMAKQHRMALLSLFCFVQYFCNNNSVIYFTIALLNIGLIITIFRRINKGVNNILCR